MDVISRDKVSAPDISGNGHLREEGCGGLKRTDIDSKGFDDFLNSSHFSRSHGKTTDDQSRKCSSDCIEEPAFTNESIVGASFRMQNNNKHEDKNVENGAVEWNQIEDCSEEINCNPLNSNNSSNLVVDDNNSTTNGCLKKESMSIHLISTLNKDSRLSGGCSDEFLEEYQSMPHIPNRASNELTNTTGTDDSLWQKQDDGCSTVCRENNSSKSSSELHHASRGSLSEKEHSKKKISFRALVRMKGLGRKLRRKHQGKAKQKQVNNKKDFKGTDPLLFSDSSAKYLLESSVSVTDDHSHSRQIAEDKQKRLLKNKKSYSFSGTSTPEPIFQAELYSSSSDIVCDEEYLEKRRFAVCEEIEKAVYCGEQTLAELRSILVIQHKLTGFGLL